MKENDLNSRELVRSIIARKPAPRCGFWLGNPHPDTWPLYHRYFGTKSEEELRQKLGDDFRWITPQYFASTYRHPEGKGIFDLHKTKKSHGEAGPLAGCETISQLEEYDWPDPGFLDFSECIKTLENTGDYYRASGFWAPFFHDVMDLLGMENYMAKMYTHPEVVDAVTERVCNFYLEANERFYGKARNLVDGYFFGNDFGTQLGLMISPAHFQRFILPWLLKFTAQAHGHGLQVILHSCGSVYNVIHSLIEAGVDCLHPLQARAQNMDAQTLAKNFKGKIAFLGGIDTQVLLVNATPEQVKAEVLRVKELLGPDLIISPSHEAILPNVSPQNIVAMSEAAHE
jgi:uroporphyrinogen decarboxylase